MAAYKVTKRSVARANASKLCKKESIQNALSSLSNQLKSLEHMPRHLIMTKLRTFMERMETDLDDASNRKYYIEALKMVNQMEGYYQHNSTVTKVDIKTSDLTFGGFDPDNFVEINNNPSDIVEPSAHNTEPSARNSDGTLDWDPESDDTDHVEPLPF